MWFVSELYLVEARGSILCNITRIAYGASIFAGAFYVD